MADAESITEGSVPSGSGWFETRVSLTGMDPDDVLRVVLPAKFADATVSEMLAHIFPTGEEEKRAVGSMFNLRTNPDLPEIYAVLLDAFDEWRKGLCTLLFSGGDDFDLDLSGPVSQQLVFSSAGAAPLANESLSMPHFDNEGFEEFPSTGLENISTGGRQLPYPQFPIHIERQYRGVDYATQSGFWGNKETLLEWLQSLTVLYFLDKHEVEIAVFAPCEAGSGLMDAVAALQSKDLISCSLDTQAFGITEEGRGFIGRLLTETESYIDLYDHFKDTEFDLDADTLDADTIKFDTGRGVDLRVQVFLAEGLDPVRTVFLLRLYDGTLDDFVLAWKDLIDDESFFDSILEPVVNRCEVDEAVIGHIVVSGYGFLEEREERARELRSQQEIIGRVRA